MTLGRGWCNMNRMFGANALPSSAVKHDELCTVRISLSALSEGVPFSSADRLVHSTSSAGVLRKMVLHLALQPVVLFC